MSYVSSFTTYAEQLKDLRSDYESGTSILVLSLIFWVFLPSCKSWTRVVVGIGVEAGFCLKHVLYTLGWFSLLPWQSPDLYIVMMTH